MRFGFVGIIAVAFLALEIVGIALAAGEIGALRIFVWLLAAALAGGWLIRSAGAGFMPELAQATANGEDPFTVMWRAGRRFLAGMLLIFPGLITDVLALLMLLTAGLPRGNGPIHTGGYGAGREDSLQQAPPHRRSGTDNDVIEGEFRRED
jgi:UPF0716 protein FxsA